MTKPTTLYAFGPQNGQTIFSWLVQLPASPNLALSFSAGYWDGHTPASQGYMMSVRVNGTPLWQHNLNAGGGWNYGSVGLPTVEWKDSAHRTHHRYARPQLQRFHFVGRTGVLAPRVADRIPHVSLFVIWPPERSQYRIERDNLRRHGFGLRLDCAGQFALGHGVGFGPIGEWHRDLHDHANLGVARQSMVVGGYEIAVSKPAIAGAMCSRLGPRMWWTCRQS